MHRSLKIWKDSDRNSNGLDPPPRTEDVATPGKEGQKLLGR